MLTSNAKNVASYAGEQASILAGGHEIARVLIHQHRAYHRECINLRYSNQRLVGNIMNAFTGTWRITSKLHGSSYDVEHM